MGLGILIGAIIGIVLTLGFIRLVMSFWSS